MSNMGVWSARCISGNVGSTNGKATILYSPRIDGLMHSLHAPVCSCVLPYVIGVGTGREAIYVPNN